VRCCRQPLGTPVNHIEVFVNGVKVELAYNKTGECFFSDNGGTTAISAARLITSSSVLCWRGSKAGYELDTSDIVALSYDQLAV